MLLQHRFHTRHAGSPSSDARRRGLGVFALALALLAMPASVAWAQGSNVSKPTTSSSAPSPDTAKEVPLSKALGDVMDRQAKAWNAGDIEGFMSGYIDDAEADKVLGDTLLYTSGGHEVHGYKALLERYQKRYGKAKSTMGTLRFGDIDFMRLGPDMAMAVGHWYVDGAQGRSVDGTFTLLWVETSKGWKIFHDHTSLRSGN